VNQVVLTAIAQEIDALRYTPAGLPVVQMRLEHVSDQVEAGKTRRVQCRIAAVALGDLALFLADTPLGTTLRIQGFLAAARKGSDRLVLHIQQAGRTPGTNGV